MFNLLDNGDDFERKAYPLFIKNKFPSYETFWQKFIVQLTNRIDDIKDIRLTEDLKLIERFAPENIEKIHERMTISQLHYSAFMMLFKAYKQKALADKSLDALENCFSHLYSALDISAELFARYDRFKNVPITDDPFNPKTSVKNSILFRRDWQRNKHPYLPDILEIREYRNTMLHSQMLGCVAMPASGILSLPNVGKIENYIDWRNLFESYRTGNTQDFMWSRDIAENAFNSVADFLEREWQKNLL